MTTRRGLTNQISDFSFHKVDQQENCGHILPLPLFPWCRNPVDSIIYWERRGGCGGKEGRSMQLEYEDII